MQSLEKYLTSTKYEIKQNKTAGYDTVTLSSLPSLFQDSKENITSQVSYFE